MQVTYIDHMGNDARVVDAARVSFDKISQNYSSEQNDKLINYLAKHEHFTPFTHPQITVREKVPIFVARQRFKHTVGFSYNETSRRYVDSPPEFYTPKHWRSKPEGSIKQGSGNEIVHSLDWLFDSSTKAGLTEINKVYRDFIRDTTRFYEVLIGNNVAPEQARMILPQSMYTEYITTGSLAAFARSYKLRSDDHSQLEIRELAKRWDEIIRPLFPISWSALVD